MVNLYFHSKDSNQGPNSQKISRIIELLKQQYLKFILVLTIFIVLLLISFSIFYLWQANLYESTNNAYVTGNLVQITPQLVGTVTIIAADEGDFVKQGQLLIQLDPSATIVAQENAEANLAKIVRQVCRIHHKFDVYKKRVSICQSELQQARINYKQSIHLAKKGVISRDKYYAIQHQLYAAKTLLKVAQQKLDCIRLLSSDHTMNIVTHPDIKNAASYLRRAYINNQHNTLVAPISGYVAKRSVQIGSYVKPGTTLMVVVPLNDLWIEANFKETQLLSIRIGQPVEIRTDLYGNNVLFHGKVESLGIGTGSTFSLLPAQNASGNWIKIVQRLPVRISLDPENLDCYPLRIGLSTHVKIDLHNTNGPVLAPHAIKKVRYATEVYSSQLHEADMLVTHIIHENCKHVLTTINESKHIMQ